MVNRKEDQGQDAIDKIKKEAGNDAKIEWVPCDMGNLAQIRDVASKFVKDEERLDLVS
jgi:NAD(P)-dependent dehydrogenase (short-subunit alcohol dehydrogenase family)